MPNPPIETFEPTTPEQPPLERKRRPTRRTFIKRAAVLLGLPLGTAVWARQVEPFWLRMHEIELSIPGLPPAFDGFRLAHLTDLHMDSHVPASYLQRMVDRVNEAKPDAIAITGDIVNHKFEW